jgi:hypothetical protein
MRVLLGDLLRDLLGEMRPLCLLCLELGLERGDLEGAGGGGGLVEEQLCMQTWTSPLT